MRMYIYIDKDIIKCLAPKISNISFDIDFFEYSEKRGYSTNNTTCIRPDIEKEGKKEGCGNYRKRLGVSEDLGVLCNTEIVKRYINIEDVSSIKNNNFYYNIVENIKTDKRIKNINGMISQINDGSFMIGDNKFLIASEGQERLIELYNNSCSVTCLGYKINCLNSTNDVFKTIAVFIE